jgi:CBS-domain-containing membrane protein
LLVRAHLTEDTTMNVEQLMSRDTRSCSPDDTLDRAARNMWDRDCGVVPITDASGRVVGMITDRDICMAAYTQNKLLTEIPIKSIAMKPVVTLHPYDSAQTAETLMQRHQLRRLAVLDDHGRLVGVLSLGDLARGAGRSPHDIPSADIARTLAAISEPRRTPAPIGTM